MLPLPPPTVAWSPLAVLPPPPPTVALELLAVLLSPPPMVDLWLLAVLPSPPPTVANGWSEAVPEPPSPAWLSHPPPIAPKSSVTVLDVLQPSVVPPPPEMVAPATPKMTVFPENPPMRLGVPEVGSIRKALLEFTFTVRGWLSVVPRKLEAGFVPALPVVLQAAFGARSEALTHPEHTKALPEATPSRP